MATTLYSQTISATTAPWRRNPDQLRSNTLFVGSPEFVPSWKKEAAPDTPAADANCYLISLGAYSDDDDSDEEVFQKVAEVTSSTEATSEPKPETFRFRRPWRVTAAEFVPRGTLPSEGQVSNITEKRSSEISSTKLPPWRRGAPSPVKASRSPSSERRSSQSTTASLSTTCSSRSRSPTPPPAEKRPGLVAPLSINSLMLWRHASACERPEAIVTSAKEFETSTVETPLAAAEVASPKKESAQEEKCWRNVAPAKKLEVSEDSWVAQQRTRRASTAATDSLSNEEIVRTMKSILNKLTLEKFDSLSNQLMHCGIRSAEQLELLIQEVFEKATTQHHFIDMYADLCSLLNSHFAANPVINDPKMNFKKILLTCCQVSFEKHLNPPEGLSSLDREERIIAECMYKMRMLGNIRFVGALLVRKMLASKVALAIMEELLQEPTPEALESLAALLTVIGASFDHPDWAHRTTLNAIFKQVEKLVKKGSIHNRVRCLLKDVLDLRNSGWKDMRPKKIEGPKKLEEVAAKAAMEDGSCKKVVTSDGWEVVGGPRLAKPTSPVAKTELAMGRQQSFSSPAKAEKAPEKTTKGTGAGKAMLDFLKHRDGTKQKAAAPFNREACREEVTATLAELRVSHDAADAILRVAAIDVPVTHQPAELGDILSKIAEESSQDVRKIGFTLVVGLFTEGQWKAESVEEGLRNFVEEICPDLKCDVPNLPHILKEELRPALQSLVTARKLQADQLKIIFDKF